jgi:hypothetical protein
MNSPADSSGSKGPRAVSRNLPGPPFLRHYPAHQLVAWQPQGALDDRLLDQIAEWLVIIEKVSLPFKRFVDFSQLTRVAIRTRHLFEFARKRAEQFAGAEPVRAALFCEDWVGYGIACLYESLMENTPIKAHAFRDRTRAAEWLEVPADVLALKDEPAAHTENRPRKRSSAA